MVLACFPEGRRRRLISGMDHLPTTEAAVTALRVLAESYEREIPQDQGHP